MLLKEIELDLPYIENSVYIENLMLSNNLTLQEAKIEDYNKNWKDKRRKFQLETKCITSMIERMCFPIKRSKFWKILIECVDEKKYTGFRNLLGVCTIQAEIDYYKFIKLSENDKKEEIVNIICGAMKEVPELSNIVEIIYNSLFETKMNTYCNEWYWNKTAQYGKLSLKVKIRHKVDVVEICMVIYEDEILILDEVVVTAIPDEREYSKYLGDVGWTSPNEAYLLSKSGNRYTIVISNR